MPSIQTHDFDALLRSEARKPSAKVPKGTIATPSDDTVNITDFASKEELFYALINIVQAHYELEIKGIQCSEININNLVLRHPKGSTKNEMRKGYLITPTDEIYNSDPVDTLPFKSLELLTDIESKIPRKAHHDMESFFYVLIWICVNYAGPHSQLHTKFDITHTSLYCWYTGVSPFWIGIVKKESMLNREIFEEDILNHCSPYFAYLKPVLRRMRLTFFDEGRIKRGCKVTHEDMIGIFRQALEYSKTDI